MTRRDFREVADIADLTEQVSVARVVPDDTILASWALNGTALNPTTSRVVTGEFHVDGRVAGSASVRCTPMGTDLRAVIGGTIVGPVRATLFQNNTRNPYVILTWLHNGQPTSKTVRMNFLVIDYSGASNVGTTK